MREENSTEFPQNICLLDKGFCLLDKGMINNVNKNKKDNKYLFSVHISLMDLEGWFGLAWMHKAVWTEKQMFDKEITMTTCLIFIFRKFSQNLRIQVFNMWM